MIIVEGCDDSGKSTLAAMIQVMINEEAMTARKVSHSVGPTKLLYRFLMSRLTLPPDQLIDLVVDRFYLSELVYQPIFRPGVQLLTPQQHEVVRSMLYTAAPFVIRCHFSGNEDKFNNRAQMFPYEKMLQVEESYCNLDIGKAAGARGVINYTIGDSHELVLRAVQNYLDWASRWWVGRRIILDHGRGNLRDNREVRVVIVGQGFARDNVWKVPFERSKSGQMVHEALRRCGIDVGLVWFTNAIKYDMAQKCIDRLRLEGRVFEDALWIGLGNVARNALETCGISHYGITHPGYHLRKGTVNEFYIKMARPLNSIMWQLSEEED